MQYSKRLVRMLVAAGALSAMLLTGAAAAQVGTAVVEGDTLYLRTGASTDTSIITTAVKGDQVIVTGDEVDGWYPVQYGEFNGYMSGEYLTVTLTGESADTAAASSEMVYGRVNASNLNLRAEPNTESEKVGSAPEGGLVEIWDEVDGWYEIVYMGQRAYVSAEYIDYDVDPFAVPSSTLGDQIVAVAQQYLGTPYVYGASGPSAFDCSGFTSYVYKQLGITLNRSAAGQTQNGTYVSRSELQPGDLVLFRHSGSSKAASHVGIYVGNGMFIHASTNDYQVRYDSVDSSYYSSIFIGGRRIV